MGNISSLNFQKTQISKSGYCFQLHHNSVIRPNYAIGGELICNHNANEAQIMRDEIIKNAKATYQKECKARNKNFQAKSYLWSAVVNIKDTTTMADLKKLTAHFKDKYGFQCYQIAIHRDEGHIDELGNKRINHHAHLEFVTLDENTGKNKWKNINKTALSHIQDEVAQILEMERGEYAEITGAKHLSGRAYGAMKQREKAERKADLNKLTREKIIPLEIQLDWLQKSNEELKKKIQVNADIKELKAQEQQLKQNINELQKEYKANRESFKQSEKATQQDYMNLKKDFETKKAEIEAELEKLKKQYDADFERRKKATARANARLKKIFKEKKRKLIDDYNQEKADIERDKKMAMIDEAIAKTNQKDNQTEFLMPNMPKSDLDMPKSDFNDNRHPNHTKNTKFDSRA